MSIQARFQLQRDAFKLDLNLEIPEQGITAIFGPSGVGKSTSLRCIAGLERVPNAYLKIGNTVWQDDAHGVFIPTWQRSLAFVFQEVNLFSHLNVEKNLLYGYKRTPIQERQIQPAQAIAWMGIDSLLQRKPEQLSGGQKQRVAIARALLTSPRLLLMDEPLTALDLISKQEIMPYLEQLHQTLPIPILYVSHSIDEVARLADFMVLLDQGQVKAAGPAQEMLTRLDLPLAQTDTATAVIDSVVTAQDSVFGLTTLRFSGGQMILPRMDLEVDMQLRLCIHARDVSISLSAASDTSILNVLQATLLEVLPGNYGLTILRLSVGEDILLSRITQKSAAHLKLTPGMTVYAQIKSVATIESSTETI